MIIDDLKYKLRTSLMRQIVEYYNFCKFAMRNCNYLKKFTAKGGESMKVHFILL